MPKLTERIHGTQFEVYYREKGFKKYGREGTVWPGTFRYVGSVGGPGTGRPRRIPPKGKEWIQDYNARYWEILSADLQGKLESDF
jgi:hypothetical protein